MMRFEGAVRSRVASWLSPWLREEVDGEIKLGLRRCHGTWTDLEFDTSKLDSVIENSTRLAVAQVRVAQIRVLFNPWSWPNLLVTVSGFHVVLVPREFSKENSRPFKSSDAESKYEVTADSIDPEGAFLREVLENSLKTANGSWMKTCLSEALASRCQLQFLDTSFRVLFDGESKLCTLRSGEISLQPRFLNHTSRRTVYTSLLFMWQKRSLSLSCNCDSLELAINENDSVKEIISLKDPAVSIIFRKLNPVVYDLSFPSIDSFLSPMDIPVVFLLLRLLSGEVKSYRRGRELWKVAAKRMSEMSGRRRFSWACIVRVVMLWLAYVHVYESLLSIVGYPDEIAITKSLSAACCDSEFSRRIRCLLEDFDKIEKKLPIATVIRARWIARKRVCQQFESRPFRSAGPFVAFKRKIFFALYFAWKFICILFRSVRAVIHTVLRAIRLREGINEVESSHSGLFTHFCERRINVFVGNFSFGMNPMGASLKTSTDKGSPEGKSPLQSMPSISLGLKSFLWRHTRSVAKKDVFVGLNSISVHFSSSVNIPLMEEELDARTQTSGCYSRVVLRSEPANSLKFDISPTDDGPSKVDIHEMIMETSLDELRLLWKLICEEEKSEMEHPFFLFQLENKFLGPSSQEVIKGFIRCISALGKLSIDLDSQSIAFVICLMEQIHASLKWSNRLCKPHAIPNQLVATKEDKLNPAGELHLFASKVQMSLLELMPLVHILIGVKVSGCNIKFSFRGIRDMDAHSPRSLLSTDLKGIELCAWPASIDKLLEIYPGSSIKAYHGEHFWLKEPSILEIPTNDLDESLTVRGRVSHNASINLSASASFENIEDSCKPQAIARISVNFDASSSRQHLHSFYASEDACSLSFDGRILKSDLVISMEELQAIFHMVSDGIISTRSRVSLDFDSAVMYSSREYVRMLLSATSDGVRAQEVVQSNDEALGRPSLQFSFDSSIELCSLNLILSRSMKTNSIAKGTSGITRSNQSSLGQDFVNLPSTNWGLFVSRFLVQTSLGQSNAELLVNISDICSQLYVPEYSLDISDKALMHCHSHQHPGLLCDLHLPYIILKLSGGCGQHSLLSDNIMVLGSVFQFLAEMVIGKMIVANGNQKILFSDHQRGGLHVWVSGTQGLQEFQFESKDGYFLLDTQKLAMFMQTAKDYSLCLKSLIRFPPDTLGKPQRENSTIMASDQEPKRAIHPMRSSELFKWCCFNIFVLNVSQFCLILANPDDSSPVRYLTIQVGLHFRFSKIEEKLLSEILYLTLFSVNSPANREDFDATLSSNMPVDLRSFSMMNHCSSTDHTGSLTSKSARDSSFDGGPEFPSNFQLSYILKKLSALFVVEKRASDGDFPSRYFGSDWLGSGSVFGFTFNISISEIQMLMEILFPFSSISTTKSEETSKQTVELQNHRSTDSSKIEISDGAVVAIKDLHQHLYFAIESSRGTHCLVGTLHYSLVGERALFRVNWHKGKPTLLVLTSLHAKDINGEAVCLNFSSGSGIVEVSKRCGRPSLWKLVPYNVENCWDASDVESFASLSSSRKAFYLVNYKSNCGVAFVDGVPECVKNPGNPIKLKVFHELTQVHDTVERNLPISNSQGQGYSDDRGQHLKGTILLHVNIKMERISVTVFEEVSGVEEQIPLVRGCIDDVNVIGQILDSKFRLMCTYFVGLDYYNSQMNLWRQVIPPIDSCMFVHSRNQVKNSDDASQGTLFHFHLRIKQVVISLSELSLDILLFISGKLDITGPYVLRNSIFRYCCKIENLSSLNLICHFGNGHDVMVAGQKTNTVFLRHAKTTDQFQDITSSMSVRACKSDGLLTLPLDISLQENRSFAWRTRFLFQEDFPSPGPCLAVKVSTKTEDGLFLSVSPLLRIHNTSGLSLELRIIALEGGLTAIIPLGIGDSMDDLKLTDELTDSRETKKLLPFPGDVSGNFLLCLKPDISCISKNSGKVFVEWSEDMPCGQAVPLADGLLDKLYQRFGESFGAPYVKSSLTTICCPLVSDGLPLSYLHFLIQISGRDLPVLEYPSEGASAYHNSMYLPQKEIFISPTVQVFNLLQTEILVNLAETYADASNEDNGIGKQATVSCGSSAYFYANPMSLYFSVTLCALDSKCKPVDTSKSVKKLQKKSLAHYFDIELEFHRGKQSAYLRLFCGERGVLEATVFSSFTLQNETELPLFCFGSSQKALTPEKKHSYSSNFPSELGLFLPPNSSSSWLSKSKRIYITLNEGNSSESLLDLDALSGFAELKFELSDQAGFSRMVRVGVSLKALRPKDFSSAQLITISARYIISNESMSPICYRFCDSENGVDRITLVETKTKATLYMHPSTGKTKTPLFDSLFCKHTPTEENSSVFIQFGVDRNGYSWSGPICISSLGRFFMKFKREKLMNSVSGPDTANLVKGRMAKFAYVHIVEESSTLVLYFHMPPDLVVPYRIENHLRGSSITLYQKEAGDPEILGPGASMDYVWDDQKKSHKLVVQISGLQLLREINIDKISPWKPFFKSWPSKLLTLQFDANRTSSIQNNDYYASQRRELRRVGYEVCVDGFTRVLRICEMAESSKRDAKLQPNSSFGLRMESFSINLHESAIQKRQVHPSSLSPSGLLNPYYNYCPQMPQHISTLRLRQ
ncbi:vacuolar protein sorting-associated protein, putative (DUF1162) isoform X2 [Wolffia australiana]